MERDKRKQVQIPEELFMELVRYHLLDVHRQREIDFIKRELKAKLDRAVERDKFSALMKEKAQSRKENGSA